jgi:hypothetical protein
VDRFLRELDAAIGGLAPAERRRAIDSVAAIAAAIPGLAVLKGISKLAFLGLIGSLSVSLSSDRTPEEWLIKAQKRSKILGLANVEALFHAVS